MRAGQCDEARAAFQKYLRDFPRGGHDVDALEALAACAQSGGDVAGEVAALEALLQQGVGEPQRSSTMLRLAAAYERNAQLKPAQALYSQWLQTFPDHPQRTEVLIRRGMISRQQRDHAQVIQDFAAVLRMADDARQRDLAHAVLADSYFQLNDCQAAQPHLTAVIGQSDRAAQQQARFRRGTCAYRNQAHALVAEDFGALVDDADFRGDRQALLLPLGYSLAALRRDTEAVARFRQFLAGDPPPDAPEQALAALGASLLRIGQVGAALPVYEQFLTAAPDFADKGRLHLQLGLLYRQRQEPEQAKRHFEAAVAGGEAPIGAEALYQWSDLLLEEEATTQATAMLQELTKRFASQARWVGIASYRLALLHEAAERWPEAWQAYRAAVTSAADPKLVEAARERAQHLEETVDVHARREPVPTPDEHQL
jgi:tetratricopeptide (TPR) repeat protein